jgi:type IV secretory pathway TrbD component
VIRLQWFATKVTLAVSNGLAAAIVTLGVGLDLAIGAALWMLAA